MPYFWRNLSFEAPAARDDSTILLVDPADPPAYNLTLRTEPLPGGAKAFAAYVVLQKPGAGVDVDTRIERTVGGKPAVVIESHLSAGGEILRQQQAIISGGDTVVVLTMTARPSAASSARAAFEKALTTLTWR